MPDPIELDPVDELGAGAIGEPGQRAFYIQARGESGAAHGAGREGAGRAARDRGRRVPRPHRRRSTRKTPISLPPTRGRAARADGAAVPRPADRARVRPRARAGADRAARALLRRRRGERRHRRARPASSESADAEEGYVARLYATRAAGAGDGARGAEAVAGRPAAVPAVRHADGPRRTPVPPLELTPVRDRRRCSPRATSRSWAACGTRRTATFLVQARADGVEIPAIYKPRRGERPLWDFPDGTLCQREVAAFECRDALGWDIVPVTVLRDDGPLGVGDAAALRRPRSRRALLHAARGARGPFRRFAVFDVLVNNTDRKGGHCLHDLPNDLVLGIDHGLTFHPAWKLRTVIWDFAERAGAARPRRRRVPRARRARRR